MVVVEMAAEETGEEVTAGEEMAAVTGEEVKV